MAVESHPLVVKIPIIFTLEKIVHVNNLSNSNECTIQQTFRNSIEFLYTISNMSNLYSFLYRLDSLSVVLRINNVQYDTKHSTVLISL